MHLPSPPQDIRPKQDDRRPCHLGLALARKITIGARLACAHAARLLPPLSRALCSSTPGWLSREVQHRPERPSPVLPSTTACPHDATRRSTETLRHLARSQTTARTSCCSPLPRACRLPVGFPSHVSRAPPERTPQHRRPHKHPLARLTTHTLHLARPTAVQPLLAVLTRPRTAEVCRTNQT